MHRIGATTNLDHDVRANAQLDGSPVIPYDSDRSIRRAPGAHQQRFHDLVQVPHIIVGRRRGRP
jgi:hypothetical protein